MKRVLSLVILIACLASVPALAADNRVAVAPDAYPYSAIAYMDVHKSCGCSGLYTGFMVAPDLMMTAASALVCPRHGGTVDKMDCCFGYMNDEYCLARFSYSGQSWKAGTDFKKDDGTYGYNVHGDYAFISVDSAIGHKTGWLGLAVWQDNSLTGTVQEMAGYSDGILMTNIGRILAGKDLIEFEGLISDPNGHGAGCPVFDGYYNVVGSLTNRGIPAAQRITDEVLAMADSLSSSNPSHTPSLPYDPADYSGATLEGQWKLMRTEVMGEDRTNSEYELEYLFKDGRWRSRTGADEEWGDGIPYRYFQGTLYKYDDSPEQALVTVSGDTLTFRKPIDTKETFQRVIGTTGRAEQIEALAPVTEPARDDGAAIPKSAANSNSTDQEDYLYLPDWSGEKLDVRIPARIIYPLTWDEAHSGSYHINHEESFTEVVLYGDRDKGEIWNIRLRYADRKLCTRAQMVFRTVDESKDIEMQCNCILENYTFKSIGFIYVSQGPWVVDVNYNAEGEIDSCEIHYIDHGNAREDGRSDVVYEKQGSGWVIHDNRGDKSEAIRFSADDMLDKALSIVNVTHTDETLVPWLPEGNVLP